MRFGGPGSPLAHEEPLWDMLTSVTTPKGNRYVLVMVDCFSRWTEACPLPDKTALSVDDAFFQHIVCRFGVPSVIHSEQGREFENKGMQELCLLCGEHTTRTTPYNPESDGLVERFNITLLMMLAMFAGENRDDWDDLLPAVMMAVQAFMNRRELVRNVHCLWTSVFQDRNRTCQTQLLALMLYGSGMHWRWPMIRSVGIQEDSSKTETAL